MNTPEDIKRMLGELVDEAVRIGRAESGKELGTGAALKEQVKRLTDDKRKIVGQLDKAIEENAQLEDEVKELRSKLAVYRVPTPRDCPFCGGLAEVHRLRPEEWYVVCGNSDCPVNPETNTFDTEAEAIEAWNHSGGPNVTCDWR